MSTISLVLWCLIPTSPTLEDDELLYTSKQHACSELLNLPLHSQARGRGASPGPIILLWLLVIVSLSTCSLSLYSRAFVLLCRKSKAISLISGVSSQVLSMLSDKWMEAVKHLRFYYWKQPWLHLHHYHVQWPPVITRLHQAPLHGSWW